MQVQNWGWGREQEWKEGKGGQQCERRYRNGNGAGSRNGLVGHGNRQHLWEPL